MATVARTTGMNATTTVGGQPVAPPEVIVRNMDGLKTAYLGFTSAVSTAHGWPLRAGETVRIPIADGQTLYSVTESGSVNLRAIYFEEVA